MKLTVSFIVLQVVVTSVSYSVASEKNPPDYTVRFQAELDNGMLLVDEPGTYYVNNLDLDSDTVIKAHPRARIIGEENVFYTGAKIIKNVHFYGGIWRAEKGSFWRHRGGSAVAFSSLNNMRINGEGAGRAVWIDEAVALKVNHVEFSDWHTGIYLGDPDRSRNVANINRFTDIRFLRVNIGIDITPGYAARGNYVDSGWFENMQELPGLGLNLEAGIAEGNVIGGVTYFEQVLEPMRGPWEVQGRVLVY